MKTRFAVCMGFVAGLVANLFPLCAVADDIRVGDSAEQVRAVLGEPRGHIRSGAYELLQYDRGRVELRDGVVTETEIVSEAEAVVLKAQRVEQQRLAQQQRALERERRHQDGLAARDRALTNPDFLASSGDRQLQFWESFRSSYPDVPIESEYTAALAKRDRDRQEAETQQRLAAMEQRVKDAEARAHEAQEDAEDAARDARRRYVYVASPYVYRPVAPCPPTTNRSAYQPTYPPTGWNAGYPYTHGYTSWASPHYVVRPSTICAPSPTIRSNGLRMNVRF